MSDGTETAILAGGCFWGVEELLRHRDGVISTRVGYSGGENDNQNYSHHPRHDEAVEIVFDPERISYRDILEFFFQIHDPTTKDRQGNDVGSSYRSEIFYTSDEQRQVAEDTIADVDASGIWPGKVVTELSEAVPFWEAEPEHQDYLQRIPNGYTCHYPRPGWKLPRRATAACRGAAENVETMSNAETMTVPHLGTWTIGYKLGKAYDASLPTLVMVHSFTTYVEQYRPQLADETLTATANLLAIEPYGHGETRASYAQY